jgi:hypothetical protein
MTNWSPNMDVRIRYFAIIGLLITLMSLSGCITTDVVCGSSGAGVEWFPDFLELVCK